LRTSYTVHRAINESQTDSVLKLLDSRYGPRSTKIALQIYKMHDRWKQRNRIHPKHSVALNTPVVTHDPEEVETGHCVPQQCDSGHGCTVRGVKTDGEAGRGVPSNAISQEHGAYMDED
jgi:hypothetical protein